MEPWTTVGVAVIVALSTLGATWLQNRHSNQRFKIELGRAIDVDIRKRRWEVRSGPLLKLRDELALMASKLDKLVKTAYHSHSKAPEQAKEEFERAKSDWNEYVSSDDLSKVLFILDDQEIIGLVKKARDEYLDSYESLAYYRAELTAVEVGKAARAPEEKIRSEIINIQALINKRLEKL